MIAWLLTESVHSEKFTFALVHVGRPNAATLLPSKQLRLRLRPNSSISYSAERLRLFESEMRSANANFLRKKPEKRKHL